MKKSEMIKLIDKTIENKFNFIKGNRSFELAKLILEKIEESEAMHPATRSMDDGNGLCDEWDSET